MTGTGQRHIRAGRMGRLGRITLDRPGKINALTAGMVDAVREALAAFARDDAVTVVMIDGAGERGLCAGGDVAAVYHGIRGDADPPERFWRDEYRMNLEISRYRKPVVALMDGIVMGGGIGISGHASMRIVTETSQVAMPETAIGLSPDVGGLYLLARAPGELGTHAALTGARLGPGDAIAAGLADRFVPRSRLAVLRDRLVDGDEVGIAVAAAAQPSQPPAPSHAPSTAPRRWPADRAWIDRCYAGDDAQRILDRLQAGPEPAAARAATTLASMSPTAVAVTLRAIRNAARMTLAQVLAQDLMLCTRFVRHPDFAEGIRARIIDKDRVPGWQPAALQDVTGEDVDAFFAPRR